MMALKLVAQSIGDYIQVSSQNPIIVLGYAKVLATNDTQITVKSKSDTYTFNLKDVSIRPGTKPTSQFIAYSPEPIAASNERENLPNTKQVNRGPAPAPPNPITQYTQPEHIYPPNFVPNVVMQAHPNYNSKYLHAGEAINIQSLGLNLANAQVVSASPSQLTVKVPGEATLTTFDSQTLGVINVTQQSSPPSPVPALPKSAPTKPNSAPSPNGLSISRHESGF
jgi:hypothetical protein